MFYPEGGGLRCVSQEETHEPECSFGNGEVMSLGDLKTEVSIDDEEGVKLSCEKHNLEFDYGFVKLFKKNVLGKKFAFSLVEIMVGVIVMSMLVAAFAPVITKKVSSTATTLSSAMGLGVESRIFLYNETKNKIDGCKLSNDKTYLECPFRVPEGVTSLNVAISGAGGGGAGAMANVENKTSTSSFTINDKVKNIKIPYLISAGGNGGNGNTYTSTETNTINPKSQADCDKIAKDLYYVSSTSSCITANNLSNKSLGTTANSIVELKSQTNNTKSDGNKICWTTGNTAYTEYNNTETATSTTGSSYHKTPVHIDVCTYPAAKEICEKFGYGTQYDGKWRLPNYNELNYIHNNHPITAYAFKKADGNIASKSNYCKASNMNSLSVYYWTLGCSGCKYDNPKESKYETYCKTINPEFTSDYFYNLCLPEYAWMSDGSYTRINHHEPGTYKPSYWAYSNWYSSKVSHYRLITYAASGGYYHPCNRRNFSTEFTSSPNDIKGGLIMLNKNYAPMSVRCSIDWMGETTSTTTVTKVGGGGASGAAITDVVIPNNLLADWQGATVIITKGIKGSNAQNDGGTSSIKIVKNGKIKFALSIAGGQGGWSAGSSSHGSGGVPTKKFTYIIDGSSTTSEYSYQQPITLFNGITFTFTPGNAGLGGSYGGVGGISPAPVNLGAGGGGQGGTTSDSYSQGQDGYAAVNYQNIYKGAAGGGGSGSSFARLENIPVKEGKIVTVRVGRGGIGGAFNTAGGIGGETSLSYDGKKITMESGEGGDIGVGATADNPNYTPIHGSGGSAVGYTISSAYKPLIIIAQEGLPGNKGAAIKNGSNLIAASGGLGGSSGINEWSLANSISASELSFGCGGMLTYAYYACYNSEVNGSFSQSDFSNPGKIYKTNNKEYGSAGAGGGGGGINYSTGDIGKGSNGQNGYIMLWWDSPQ